VFLYVCGMRARSRVYVILWAVLWFHTRRFSLRNFTRLVSIYHSPVTISLPPRRFRVLDSAVVIYPLVSVYMTMHSKTRMFKEGHIARSVPCREPCVDVVLCGFVSRKDVINEVFN
jgi:hypothetical protein